MNFQETVESCIIRYSVLFYYSFKTGKNIFIVLDNVGKSRPGHQQIEWLENELKKSRDYDNCIIFLHRPLYDSDGNNNSQSMPEDISLKLIDLFLNYHVSHIFASQRNGFHEGDFRGIPYTLTGGSGTAPYSRHRKHSFSHFLKVNVEKDNIDVEIKKEFSPGFHKRKHVNYGAIVIVDNMIRVYRAELTLLFIIILSFAFYIIRNRKKNSRNK